MTAIDIMTNLIGRAGQHIKMVWQRACHVKADCPFLIVKRVEAHVRSGIAYANLIDIREGIEAGTREPVAGLPWGQWREGFTNYIIDHTPKGQLENVEYIRLYPPTFENLKHPTVTYLIDGAPATFEQVEPYLLEREKREEFDSKVFTVRASDVVSIGRQPKRQTSKMP